MDAICIRRGSLKSSNIINNTVYRYLLEFIIAIRFAWLSQWLRKEDEEMVDLEETYMKLFIDNSTILKNNWNLTSSSLNVTTAI